MGIVVSIAIAFIVTRIPALGLSGFAELAAILIASDLVLYVLTKARMIKALREPDQ
jgi:multisubunit Na+/H+ antiporter MnhB subunit